MSVTAEGAGLADAKVNALSSCLLRLEVEQLDSNDRWHGEFTAQCKFSLLADDF
jgi:hypothetical protein